MARLPRNTDPSYIRHISIRVEGAALRLLPDAQLNQIIGGVLAKYQQTFSIIIYAYTVLSNHLHILTRAPKGNLWRFEQAVNREIAKRINKLRNNRGHFWERRYDEQMLAEENDIIEAFLYVTCNPVSHGLVEHPALWPGLNCYAHALSEIDRVYTFTDYTAFGKACRMAKNTGKRVSIKEFQSEHKLQLTPLPQYKKHSSKERQRVISKLIAERVAEIKQERKRNRLGFLGRKAVMQQHHSNIPQNVKRSPRPICYTKSWEAKKRFMEWFFPWLEAFYEASRQFRSGKLTAKFPEHSIMPPYHYTLPVA